MSAMCFFFVYPLPLQEHIPKSAWRDLCVMRGCCAAVAGARGRVRGGPVVSSEEEAWGMAVTPVDAYTQNMRTHMRKSNGAWW